MPRQARLDAPGTLHHVIIRGLERRAIVKDDTDRAAFVTRLAGVAQETGTGVGAWACLPNHAHLLLRSSPAGRPQFMRRLLPGYAVAFNRWQETTGAQVNGGNTVPYTGRPSSEHVRTQDREGQVTFRASPGWEANVRGLRTLAQGGASRSLAPGIAWGACG